jgi:hypothetical protein
MQRAKNMNAKQREELFRVLKARFEKNMNRHQGLEWAKVQAKLDPPVGLIMSHIFCWTQGK